MGRLEASLARYVEMVDFCLQAANALVSMRRSNTRRDGSWSGRGLLLHARVVMALLEGVGHPRLAAKPIHRAIGQSPYEDTRERDELPTCKDAVYRVFAHQIPVISTDQAAPMMMCSWPELLPGYTGTISASDVQRRY